MARWRLLTAAGTAALCLTAAACSSSSSSSSKDSASPAATSASASGDTSATGGASATASAAPASNAAITGKVTVFAAASLQKTFTALGKQFEQAHPGVKVSFNFGGSDTLAASITSGAPADVFAAASEATMKTVTSAGDAAATPVDFAKNELEIAVRPGNPKHITTLQALTGKGVKVALCAKTVPCGAAAVTALGAAGVKLTPVTYEQDVTSALTKVELGEVDAALVYQTDVKGAAGKVDGVNFSAAAMAVTSYPIAALKHAPNATAAQEFVAFVTSAPVEAQLQAAGFQAP